MARFSKQRLLTALACRAATIQAVEHFDSGNGWAQVADKAVPAEHTRRAVAYGYYRALSDLIENIESGELLD